MKLTSADESNLDELFLLAGPFFHPRAPVQVAGCSSLKRSTEAAINDDEQNIGGATCCAHRPVLVANSCQQLLQAGLYAAHARAPKLPGAHLFDRSTFSDPGASRAVCAASRLNRRHWP